MLIKESIFLKSCLVLQQSNTSSLKDFLKDCYRFLFYSFLFHTLFLQKHLQKYWNSTIVCRLSNCTKPLSVVLPTKQCGTENPHTLALWKPAAKAAGRVIDDTIRTQIYSQADASIAPGSRKGPIRWGETLNISLYNLLVSKGFMLL